MHPANKTLVEDLKTKYENQKIVFVSGNFNIVHPGHLRIFEFAKECGDVFIVGVNRQGHSNTIIADDIRLDNVQKTADADEAVILSTEPEIFIQDLRPDIVVKGKEHEARYNPELDIIEGYGGKLLFSSGDARFASLSLLQQELNEISLQGFIRPNGYMKRQGFTHHDLLKVIEKFKHMNVVVIGDLIVDEYITCDPLGMSQEDPTIVVSPIKTDRFIGGAAIVAAHAKALSANVSYFGLCGQDDIADYAREKINEYNVNGQLFEDESRPTTLKQRYRASSKTLLRVSQLRQHDMNGKLLDDFFEGIKEKLNGANLVIFSDFNYGCLPQSLVDMIIKYCQRKGIMMFADSQASSQIGDVSRFTGMTLITPTEREARIATHDHTSGLTVLAENLRTKASADNVLITLGAEGMLIHARHHLKDDLITDRLPAFNHSPKDVAGAGDSLLAGASLALACGLPIWGAAYIGSIVAACQVGRVGNQPVNISLLRQELSATI